MTSKQALLKFVPFVLAACLGAFGGGAIAAGDTDKADQQKVDCKQYPDHPECKGKTN